MSKLGNRAYWKHMEQRCPFKMKKVESEPIACHRLTFSLFIDSICRAKWKGLLVCKGERNPPCVAFRGFSTFTYLLFKNRVQTKKKKKKRSGRRSDATRSAAQRRESAQGWIIRRPCEQLLVGTEAWSLKAGRRQLTGHARRHAHGHAMQDTSGRAGSVAQQHARRAQVT